MSDWIPERLKNDADRKAFEMLERFLPKKKMLDLVEFGYFTVFDPRDNLFALSLCFEKSFPNTSVFVHGFRPAEWETKSIPRGQQAWALLCIYPDPGLRPYLPWPDRILCHYLGIVNEESNYMETAKLHGHPTSHPLVKLG